VNLYKRINVCIKHSEKRRIQDEEKNCTTLKQKRIGLRYLFW
jgi:hypothetical protein